MSDAFSTDDFDSLGQRGAQKKRASGEKAGANGEKIREGGRHHFLVSMAGTLRKRGLSLAAIEAALLEINLTMCEPPQDEADVRRIARDMGAKPAGDGVNRSPPSDSGESESSREDRLRRLLVGFTAADAFDETGRAKPPPERAYAVEHLLPLGVHGLVVGPGGLGKGLAEVAFADHIARGVPIPACRWRDGGVPEAVSLKIGERRGVLLVCKEDDRDELLRRIIAYRALRAGDDWQGSIDSAERALLARNLHLIALPAPVEMDRLFVRLIAERARHLDGPAWIALDPLGRFLFRDSDGRVLRFIEGEYAVLVSDLCAELAERTGACVSPVHHMRRAARQALHEGGEAARSVRADPYGSELLLSFARFSVGLEPLTRAADLDALRLGAGRTWLRLAAGKSNYSDPDVQVVLERVGGAVQVADLGALPLDTTWPGRAAGPERTPADLGLLVGEDVTVAAVTRRLLGIETNPGGKQRARGERLIRGWAERGWVAPRGERWRIVQLGTEAKCEPRT